MVALPARDHALLLDLQQRIATLEQREEESVPAELSAAIDALETAVAALEASVAADVAALEATDTALEAVDTALQSAVSGLGLADTALEGDIDAVETSIAVLQHQVNVNLLSNPSFRTNTTGYSADTGASITRSNAAGVAYVGTWGLVVTVANLQYSGVFYASDATLVPGLDYTFSAYARLAVAGSKAVGAWIIWYDSDNDEVSSVIETFTLDKTTYTDSRYSVTGTAPAGSDHAELYLITDAAEGIYDIWTDGWQFEEAVATPLNTADFFPFGASENIKNQRMQGYDRESDSLQAGSAIAIENFTDAPNIWFKRRDDSPTVTGFTNATQIGRIGAQPMDRNTDNQFMWDNGTDGEMAHIIFRLRLEDDGDTKVGGFSVIEFHVVDSRSEDADPAPFLCLEVSGEDGGRIIYHGIEANGDPITIVLAEPTT